MSSKYPRIDEAKCHHIHQGHQSQPLGIQTPQAQQQDHEQGPQIGTLDPYPQHQTLAASADSESPSEMQHETAYAGREGDLEQDHAQ
ncbi:hypothetical protein BD779DRAFT_1562224, partial [Infundibulicybe gibba]